jgi:hypothetical protein
MRRALGRQMGEGGTHAKVLAAAGEGKPYATAETVARMREN